MNRIRVEKEDSYYSINNADILDLHINKQGNVDLLVVDTYDFNKNDANDLVKLAREHQDRGDLVPYFIIYHVELPISSLKINNIGKYVITKNRILIYTE